MVAPFSTLASHSIHFLWTPLAPQYCACHSTTPRLDHNSTDLFTLIPWLFYHSYSLSGELYRNFIPDPWLKNLLWTISSLTFLTQLATHLLFQKVFYDSLHITPPTLWFEDHKNKAPWKLCLSVGTIVPSQPPKFWWWLCRSRCLQTQHGAGQ